MRMHIAEGFLPLVWCIFWYLVAIPFVVWGAINVGKIYRDHPEQKLTLAVSGAFIFVLSALKLPSIAGSSSHPTGTGLSAILFGPATTSLLSAIVLVFQTLLLAHGGLTTLGANIFSMGVAGPAVGFFIFKLLHSMRVRIWIQVFTAAVLSNLVTYAVTGLQLALAYPSAEGLEESWSVFFGVFLVTQIPLAIAEGILFVIFFDYLSKSKPKLIAQLFGETK